ncbi:2,3-bisphosphoglycerate-independent phosphoglycerate mutase [Candidatus Dependentiae bacterium]|jgi:2,3-bisphosphoglycerate-independent phosphoglycerate mutase|nr:2,3-bisphosphoglycerate-independent phosphoglycerate mutase [Candidatus Dependentiae bacterium]
MPHNYADKPLALIILDGFGLSPHQPGNAVTTACMPTWEKLWKNYPHASLQASGEAVGLLPGFIGNSEVGHLTLGAGRVIPSVFKEFHQALVDGSLYFHPVLNKRFSTLAQESGRLHIMGLVSDGGVHSHEAHLHALIKRAAELGIQEIFVHAFLDGRDVAPKSASIFLDRLDRLFIEVGKGKLASIQGRFFAMDRDNNWERTEQCYRMLTQGSPATLKSWHQLLESFYAENITDEFIPPTLLIEQGKIQPHDGVLFFNFRPDRARQLTRAFLDPSFKEFKRTITRNNLAWFITTTRYSYEFCYWNNDILFQDSSIQSTLLDEMHSQTNGQLKTFVIAETEKYAHVTYFFRGMREIFKPEEIYILVPSIKSKNYSKYPEMSAEKITQHVVKSLKKDAADFYLINYANADMVGHSGDFKATVQACECLDQQLSILYEEIVIKRDGTLFITADHGNAEHKIDTQTGQPLTAHTTNPVPLIMVNQSWTGRLIDQTQKLGLSNIAPTILEHYGLQIPKEMSHPIILE